MSIIYICENCGDIIEIEEDSRTDNSYYDGDLKHTVPVCYCQILEKENMLSDHEVQMDRESEKQEALCKAVKEQLESMQILMDNKKYADSRKILANIIKTVKTYN